MSKHIVQLVIVATLGVALVFALIQYTDGEQDEQNEAGRETQHPAALSTQSVLDQSTGQPTDVSSAPLPSQQRLELPETILGSYEGGNTTRAGRDSQLRYERDRIERLAEELKDAQYQEDKLRLLADLSRLPPSRPLLDACGRMLADPDPAVKYAAMQILWDFDDPSTAEVLEQLLDRRFAPNLVHTLTQEGRLEEFKQTIEEVVAGAN